MVRLSCTRYKERFNMNFKVFLIVGAIFFVCWFSEVTSRMTSWICLKKCRCSEIQDTFVVDCSNTGLQSVPRGLPLRVTDLILNNNKIKVLNNDSFVQSKGGGLPNLTTLVIKSNQLKNIEINAFRGLHNLKILDLYDNCLEFMISFPQSVFIPHQQIS